MDQRVYDAIIKEYLVNPNFNRKNLSIQLNCGERYVYKALKKYRVSHPRKSSEHILKEYSNESAHIEINSFTICTLEDALISAEVDLEKWQVDHFITNSWEVTLSGENGPETKVNHQVKVWLKPKISNPIEIALRNIIKDIPKFKAAPPRFVPPSDIAAEIVIVDSHFGKFAWGKEVGVDYDTQIAVRCYKSACETNLERIAPYRPEKIYFILGNDLLHVENYAGTTPMSGHRLDMDTRLPRIYEMAKRTVIECIYRCRSLASVEIIRISGNHDMHAAFFLCDALKEHFSKDKYVTVDNSPRARKARLHGRLLVGWAHDIAGNINSWANELAQAFPMEWSQSIWREWHCGHKHKKKETKMHPVMTHGGVLVRQLTALSPVDAWHYENLFTDAVPGGEAFLWSKKDGIIANLISWSDPKLFEEDPNENSKST